MILRMGSMETMKIQDGPPVQLEETDRVEGKLEIGIRQLLLMGMLFDLVRVVVLLRIELCTIYTKCS